MSPRLRASLWEHSKHICTSLTVYTPFSPFLHTSTHHVNDRSCPFGAAAGVRLVDRATAIHRCHKGGNHTYNHNHKRDNHIYEIDNNVGGSDFDFDFGSHTIDNIRGSLHGICTLGTTSCSRASNVNVSMDLRISRDVFPDLFNYLFAHEHVFISKHKHNGPTGDSYSHGR